MSTARFFKQDFEQNGRMESVALFLNLGTRVSLTTAQRMALTRTSLQRMTPPLSVSLLPVLL